jgi:general secretion pathway protein I
MNLNTRLSREAHPVFAGSTHGTGSGFENAVVHFEIRNSGFTLLEVMVAVTIMSMVLVTLIGLKNSSMQNVALAEHITTATMLAKRAMIDATATRPLLPAEDEGEFPEDNYKGYSWKKTIVPTPLILIMEVHVAVLWKEGTRDESVELVSYE